MAISSMTIFMASWAASFLGTLPFGPINLSVVDTTINRSFRAALRFSTAAALVEIIQSWIAIHISWNMGQMLIDNPWTKLGAFILFLTLGLFFFLKKGQDNKKANIRHRGDFAKGLFISFLNPQAIPFWIFVLTYLDSSQIVHLDVHAPFRVVAVFLLGVSIGKFAALVLFGLLGKHIARRSQLLSKWMNKIIGAILMSIGLFQMMQILV